MNTNTGTGPLGGGLGGGIGRGDVSTGGVGASGGGGGGLASIGGGRRHHGGTATGGYAEPELATGAGQAGMGAGNNTAGQRGPLRAAADALTGNTAGTAGGAGMGGTGTTGVGIGNAGRHQNHAGTLPGTGNAAVAGTGAGYGASSGMAGGGVKPPMGQRIAGETEKLAGQALGNPVMVARGQEKKTGVPASAQYGGGVGNNVSGRYAGSGPGAY